MKKTLLSLLILAVFIAGMGRATWLPSLRLLQDTQWDGSLFIPTWSGRCFYFLWIIPAGIGFLGWSVKLRAVFLRGIDQSAAPLLGWALAVSLFSLYVFGLAINEILFWPLVFLFFAPSLPAGWECFKTRIGPWRARAGKNWRSWALAIPALLWALEYLSAPIAWDAVLDHYRFAREVARLHQVLFHWVNHTGDMPKGAELILAGFWSLGGESLAKLSSAIPAILTACLLPAFGREGKGGGWVAGWIFWTCPFFLALYSWGYVEGYLAFFEVLAVYCFWMALQNSRGGAWLPLCAFFLGTAFAIKYTAALALGPVLLIYVYEKVVRKNPLKINLVCFLIFALPLFPWFFKNWLAFGNPLYPLPTPFLGGGIGYSPEMEQGLLTDTGFPKDPLLSRITGEVWSSFFTASNGVNAAMAPLVVMVLPWFWTCVKKRIAIYLVSFSALFFTEWFFMSSSLRHAAAGTVLLAILAAWAWEEAIRAKQWAPKFLLTAGIALSLWLCVSAQLTATAPYASALGLEDPLLRLKRNYSFDLDVYQAYRGIEAHSEVKDKVVAFAVFQTYPLDRIAFVDFKWKRPVFYQWVSRCKTAEELTRLMRKEGVRYFLFQKKEAAAMAKLERDFNWVGLPMGEYDRFWRNYMEPVGSYENTMVYELKDKALERTLDLSRAPGLL